MVKPSHQRALDVLVHRRGRWSRAVLRDGRICRVYDVAWGFDLGDDVAHVTTNVSPGPSTEHVVDFFRADEISRIEDSETGAILFDIQTG